MSFNQFTNLDFNSLRTQIKDYLRGSSKFTDFDFEGSNFSVLIDTLATVTIIEDQIRETIGNFEPRVDNLGVEVNAIPDTNILDVKILFDIRGLDVPTQSFSFILEPTR